MDEQAARAFLRHRFGSGAEVTVMRPGEWSAAYAVRTADQDLVARFSAFDEDFEKDAYAARYGSEALPIPEIIEWGPAGDGFYAVAARMPGEHIDGLDEAGMRRVLPSLFATLDAIRAVDLTAASGFGGWRTGASPVHRTWHEELLGVATGPATRGSPGWRALLETSPGAVATFEEGYAQMRELVTFCPEERHLVHEDLINFNVLVDGDRIKAIRPSGTIPADGRHELDAEGRLVSPPLVDPHVHMDAVLTVGANVPPGKYNIVVTVRSVRARTVT